MYRSCEFPTKVKQLLCKKLPLCVLMGLVLFNRTNVQIVNPDLASFLKLLSNQAPLFGYRHTNLVAVLKPLWALVKHKSLEFISLLTVIYFQTRHSVSRLIKE